MPIGTGAPSEAASSVARSMAVASATAPTGNTNCSPCGPSTEPPSGPSTATCGAAPGTINSTPITPRSSVAASKASEGVTVVCAALFAVAPCTWKKTRSASYASGWISSPSKNRYDSTMRPTMRAPLVVGVEARMLPRTLLNTPLR